MMAINVTSIPATLTVRSSDRRGGRPSGIIVDNNVNTTTAPQSSILYFSNQAPSGLTAPCGVLLTGIGCAVKVTQAALN